MLTIIHLKKSKKLWNAVLKRAIQNSHSLFHEETARLDEANGYPENIKQSAAWAMADSFVWDCSALWDKCPEGDNKLVIEMESETYGSIQID